MKTSKKIFYGGLCLLLGASILFNLTYNRALRNNIGMKFANTANKFKENQLYGISTGLYITAQKIAPNITWLDYYIAQSLRSKYWGTPLTPKKKADLELAIKHLNAENVKHPNNGYVYSEYAYVYHQLEEFDKAIEYYKKVLEKNPKDKYALEKLSYIYCNIKFDYQKALDYQNKKMALGIDEGKYGDYFSKAYILAQMDRHKEAVEYYKKYIEKNPTHVAGLVNVSNSEIKIGKYDDADKHIDEGLNYAPTFSYLLNLKVDILKHKHKFEEAEELSNKILKRNKYNYSTYWDLAEISRYNGDMKQAEKYYKMSKDNAQEYYDQFCENPYDIGDYDGKCGNRYEFLKNFEKNKNKPLKF